MANTNRTRMTIGILISAGIILANVILVMSGDMQDFYGQVQVQLTHWGLLPESAQLNANTTSTQLLAGR